MKRIYYLEDLEIRRLKSVSAGSYRQSCSISEWSSSESISVSSLASAGCPPSLAHGLTYANLFSSHIFISDSNPPTSFCKAPHDIIGPTCIIQDHLISRWWLNHQFPFVRWGIVFTNSRDWDVDFSGGRALCSLIWWCYKSSSVLPWPDWPTPMTNLCCGGEGGSRSQVLPHLRPSILGRLSSLWRSSQNSHL